MYEIVDCLFASGGRKKAASESKKSCTEEPFDFTTDAIDCDLDAVDDPELDHVWSVSFDTDARHIHYSFFNY